MAEHTTVGEIRRVIHEAYPPQLAESWDAVGLVCGDPADEVRTVAFALDCTQEVADKAVELGAQMLVVHHPLLLRGVTSVAADTPKGKVIHTLIRNGVALLAAHTNADKARPGVNDKLAELVGITPGRPIVPVEPYENLDEALGLGRVGELEQPMTLREFTQRVADALPETEWGVRAAGDPERVVKRVAVSSGSGDSFLDQAAALGVDVYVTSDLRHHPVDEHLRAAHLAHPEGPAVVDTAHWASEFPWTTQARDIVENALRVNTEIIDVRTDPWTISAHKEN
ncbi:MULTISPECIES: Nif3-like dinuclear metal center hexameric protein [Corynebacterium]|uniref:GTP cyclohydrolase 1 type 2 homolog n=1 Tax=Corynebacterium aurimucosum TaxID=169292 RepID=A0A2N6TRK7_9CORY|nr:MULTISPECIES: Nif3-like dinuclear metal center hexameric protein [Corynebacterium]OFK64108.1 Nif3-like dinuclear metal center hexameric protein [Corynebacterium sp. HMSC074A09]OFK67411.1 Nif3-like dinuclear metal center hexameric protein [Corynebacterium sp. HMSC076G08]OFO98358.1 Nif3-like dinuclear metal center hexameric protein [Corynebacterium sp. HMSC034H07]PMC71947.1 Nif3-like dinuclear metal center hexameric protein [Corynebacterium aurimucosum]TVU86684.1 Nif3-like dinuclear metal cen